MKFIKNLRQLIGYVLKSRASWRQWLLPEWAVRRRLELERLDRIRHPDKYLGK